jgi:prepilin-type N-terminal cleavage/methylation domain-containing protein
MKKSNNKSAFTMVEILISIAIFSVILFVSVKVFDFTFLNMNNDKKLLQTFY